MTLAERNVTSVVTIVQCHIVNKQRTSERAQRYFTIE